MSQTIDIKVPDIGDFKDVPVIEIFVKVGDTVKAEDPLVSLESDKATMDIPSPYSGVVKALKIKVGDKVATSGADGSHAELRSVPERSAWHVPDGFDVKLASVMPVAFGTADDCLFEFGRLRGDLDPRPERQAGHPRQNRFGLGRQHALVEVGPVHQTVGEIDDDRCRQRHPRCERQIHAHQLHGNFLRPRN